MGDGVSVNLPPDVQDPEIVHRLKISLLLVPGKEEFKPKVDVKDAKKYSEEMLVMLGGMDQLERWNDWQTDVLKLHNRQLRSLEAEMIRREVIINALKENQKEQGWAFSFGKWMAVIITSGIVAALLKSLLDYYIKRP